jgi:hypothetical protein
MYSTDQFAETQRLAVGVEVYVPRAHLAEARRAIESLHQEAAAGYGLANKPAGPCPKCGEAIEPGFGVCWKCGAALQ